MGRKARSDTVVQEFRERLVEAATHLFATQGFEGVTLRAVAAALGVSPMTPYRYFRDKEEIFAAVRATAYESFAWSQQEAYDSTADPIARLRALGLAYQAWARAPPDAYRLMFSLRQPDPTAFGDLRDAELRGWHPLYQAVEAAGAALGGHLQGEPNTLAHLLWCGMHGIVSLDLAGKLTNGRTADDLVGPMMDVMARGGRDPSAGPEES